MVDDVDELVGTTGLSVTAKVKIMSEPMYSIRHMVKEMVLDEFDDVGEREGLDCRVRRTERTPFFQIATSPRGLSPNWPLPSL